MFSEHPNWTNKKKLQIFEKRRFLPFYFVTNELQDPQYTE